MSTTSAEVPPETESQPTEFARPFVPSTPSRTTFEAILAKHPAQEKMDYKPYSLEEHIKAKLPKSTRNHIIATDSLFKDIMKGIALTTRPVDSMADYLSENREALGEEGFKYLMSFLEDIRTALAYQFEHIREIRRDAVAKGLGLAPLQDGSSVGVFGDDLELYAARQQQLNEISKTVPRAYRSPRTTPPTPVERNHFPSKSKWGGHKAFYSPSSQIGKRPGQPGSAEDPHPPNHLISTPCPALSDITSGILVSCLQLPREDEWCPSELPWDHTGSPRRGNE